MYNVFFLCNVNRPFHKKGYNIRLYKNFNKKKKIANYNIFDIK